jgi:hypothetical protein
MVASRPPKRDIVPSDVCAVGGAAAMLHELSHMDLKGWHPRHDAPKKKALTDQKILSLSAEDQWWHQLLETGGAAAAPN